MPESDYSAAMQNSRPKALAAIFHSRAERGRLWRPDELAAIFKHQLSAPVLVDLGGFDPNSAARIRRLGEAQDLLLRSFSELFHHPCPPIELLEATKSFAKANMDHPESALPSEVAAALYYTSIASALVRLGERITKLGNSDLLRGLAWAGEQPWVDSETKGLLEQARGVILGTPEGSS